MLIKQFYDFKYLLTQLDILAIVTPPDEANTFLEMLEKVFYYFGNNKLNEGINELKSVITFIQARPAFLTRINLSLNSIKDPDNLYVEKLTAARKFYKFVCENLATAEKLAHVAKVMRAEQQKGLIPSCSKVNDLENATDVLNQVFQHDFVKAVINPFSNFELNEFTKLTLKELELLDYNIIQTLVMGRVIDLKELSAILPRINEFKQHLDYFNSDGVRDLTISVSKSLSKQNLHDLLLNLFQNTTIKVIQFTHFLSLGTQLADTPEFNQFLHLAKSANFEILTIEIEHLILSAHARQYPERPLHQVLHDFVVKSPDVEFPLNLDEIKVIAPQYIEINNHAKSLAVLSHDELAVQLQQCKDDIQKNIEPEKAKLKILAIIRENIKRYQRVFPYNVQMLNVLAFLNDKDNRRIAQIKTGEGKSTVIAMLAAYLYLVNGEKTDIITTSRDLAKRDSAKYKDFYQSLGMTVGDNAHDNHNKQDYKPDIVYGTNYDFEFAYLEEQSYCENIRDSIRPYRVVIVDEVDSMFLDMQRNSARLAGEASNAKDYLRIYQFIWDYVNSQKEKNKDAFHQAILSYVANNLPDCQINIDKKLTSRWFNAGLNAIKYKEGREYVILNQKIEIVDYEHTGQVYYSSRWDNGLHSLLEIKHGLPVNPETLIISSITHVDYFNLYKKIYGLTGTLGTATDRQELKKLYHVNFYDSPPYSPSLKRCAGHIITNDAEEKNAKIVEVVKEKVATGRPTLIICESINHSNEIYNLLKNGNASSCLQVYNAIQDALPEAILALAGNPGASTVATNTAGRGADINISKVVAEKGGLHVIVVVATKNKRVEIQAFGRAGRQGQPGSYQYILEEDEILDEGDIEAAIEDALDVDDDNVLVGIWDKKREKQAAALSKQHLTERVVWMLQHTAQNFFFSLPKPMRVKSQEAWGEHYTRIDQFIRQHNYDIAKYAILRKFVCEEMNAFFKKIFTHPACPTLLHYAVESGDEKLTSLIVATFPEMLTVTDNQKRTPYQLAQFRMNQSIELLTHPSKVVTRMAGTLGQLFIDREKQLRSHDFPSTKKSKLDLRSATKKMG